MLTNPFRPNSPVNPGMFVGRNAEIKRLEAALLQTRAEQPAHFIITGERGIGKTSLLLYLRAVANGLIPIENHNVKFLILDVDIDASTTQLGLIQRIQLAIDRELGQSEKTRSFLKETWSFIKRVQIMDSGISENTSATSQEVLCDEFAYNLAKIAERTCSNNGESFFNAKYDGIIVLIDEADNCSASLQLGSFLKLLLERLQKHNCNQVLVGLAGLPDIRNKLIASHPSSIRMFEELPLSRLSESEVGSIIDLCLKKTTEINIQTTKISDEAKSLLIGLSEGYPHFVQQFGYSAFAADTDFVIDLTDVKNGAFDQRGALEQIGDRYYRNDFYNKIQKDSYRQVLRIMADDLDAWVTRARIRIKFKGDDSTLNNAIKALRDRHIIFSKEGERGVYRLQHKGFALWIKFYADPDFLKNYIQSHSESKEVAHGT